MSTLCLAAPTSAPRATPPSWWPATAAGEVVPWVGSG